MTLKNRISSRGSYDNTGKRYNVSRIINDDASLNIAEYENYSPLFLSYGRSLLNQSRVVFSSDVTHVW